MSEVKNDWQHQTRALEFLERRQSDGRTGSMLGMDTGTGKSRVVVRWCDEQEHIDVLILCPKVVLSVWSEQFKMHSDRQWYCHTVNAKYTIPKRFDRAQNAREIAHSLDRPFALCVNYEAAWREPFAEWLKNSGWNLLVMDESHRIKTPGAKASRFCSQMKGAAEERLALTGTPMSNSPMDLYAQWRALDTDVFGTSFNRFKNMYAIEQAMQRLDGKMYNKITDYKNMDDLKAKAGKGTFIVSKRDVLDLPPVTHETIHVELSPATRKVYDEFERELMLELEAGIVTVDNALVKLLRLQQITSGYIKRDMRPIKDEFGRPMFDDRGRPLVEADDERMVDLGSDKSDALADWMVDFEQSEPLVVFARFTHDLAMVRRVAESQGRTYVELSGKANGYEAWRKGYGHVLGVQIQSGGVGVDFTRSAYCMYYSVGFSLNDYQQSLGRMDRHGQTRPVTVYHLVAVDTVDVKVRRALNDKRKVIQGVIEEMGYVRTNAIVATINGEKMAFPDPSLR